MPLNNSFIIVYCHDDNQMMCYTIDQQFWKTKVVSGLLRPLIYIDTKLANFESRILNPPSWLVCNFSTTISSKKSSKRNQNPSRYNNSKTKSQVSTQAKISSFKISSYKKIDLLLLLLPRGQNPLSYYILYDESKHNILALVGKTNK